MPPDAPVKAMDIISTTFMEETHSPETPTKPEGATTPPRQAHEADGRRKHHKKPGSHEDGTNHGEPGENGHREEGQ